MSSTLNESGDPHFKAEPDLEEQLRVSHGDEIARFWRICVLIFIAFQKRGDADIGPSHLLGQIF